VINAVLIITLRVELTLTTLDRLRFTFKPKCVISGAQLGTIIAALTKQNNEFETAILSEYQLSIKAGYALPRT